MRATKGPSSTFGSTSSSGKPEGRAQATDSQWSQAADFDRSTRLPVSFLCGYPTWEPLRRHERQDRIRPSLASANARSTHFVAPASLDGMIWQRAKPTRRKEQFIKRVLAHPHRARTNAPGCAKRGGYLGRGFRLERRITQRCLEKIQRPSSSRSNSTCMLTIFLFSQKFTCRTTQR